MRLSTLHGIRYEVIDILDPATPTGLARWGSPTILVDGEDVAEQSRGDGIGCRIYDTPAGVPSAETIAAAIRDRSGANRDRRG